jgi:hypothetical protein
MQLNKLAEIYGLAVSQQLVGKKIEWLLVFVGTDETANKNNLLKFNCLLGIWKCRFNQFRNVLKFHFNRLFLSRFVS